MKTLKKMKKKTHHGNPKKKTRTIRYRKYINPECFSLISRLWFGKFLLLSITGARFSSCTIFVILLFFALLI